MGTSPLPPVLVFSVILLFSYTYSGSFEFPPPFVYRLLSYLPLSSLLARRDQGNNPNDDQITGPEVPAEAAEDDRTLLSGPVPGSQFLPENGDERLLTKSGLQHQAFFSDDASLQRFFVETSRRLLDGRSDRIRRQDSTPDADDSDPGNNDDYYDDYSGYYYYDDSASGQSGDGTEYYYYYDSTTAATADYYYATEFPEEQGGNPDETTSSQTSSLATVATTAVVTVTTTKGKTTSSATPVDSNTATTQAVSFDNGIVFIPVTFPPGLVTSKPPENGIVVSAQADPNLFIPPGVQMSVSPTGEVTFQIPDGLKWKDIKNTFTDKSDKRFWRKIFRTVKNLRKENSGNGGFNPIAGESSFQVPAEVTYDAVVQATSGMSLKQLILLRRELQQLRFLSKRSQTSMKIYVQGGLTNPPPGVTLVSAPSGGQVVEIPNILRWRDVRGVIEDPVQKSLWKQVFASRDVNIRLLQGDIYELIESIDYVKQLIREKRWSKRQNKLKNNNKKKTAPRNGKTLFKLGKKKKKKSKRKQNMSKKKRKEKRKKRRQKKRKKKKRQKKKNSKKKGKNSPKLSREGRNWRKDIEKEKQNKRKQKKKGKKKNENKKEKVFKKGSKKRKSNNKKSNKQDDIFKSLIPSNSNLAGGTISFNPISLTTDNKGNGKNKGKKGKADKKSQDNKSILDILLQSSKGNSRGGLTEPDNVSKKNFGTNFWEKKKQENPHQDIGKGGSFFSNLGLSNSKNDKNSSKKKQKTSKDKRKKGKKRKNNNKNSKQNKKNKEKNNWLFAY